MPTNPPVSHCHDRSPHPAHHWGDSPDSPLCVGTPKTPTVPPPAPVTDQVTFGQNLRRLRLSQNLTQEFLSHRAGVHWTLPGQVERGERNPTLKTILLLAKGLAVHPSELFLTPKETGTGDPAMINISRPEMSPAIAEAMKADKGSFTRTLTNDA